MVSDISQLYNLSDKSAVVTGGGSGFGREFCKTMAEFGADIACLDLHMDRAEETCDSIKGYGHKSIPIRVDVSQSNEVHIAFEQILTRFGKLDILVNNAGIAPPSALIDETNLEDWHKVIGVNLHGVFYCMREGLRIMRIQRSGLIINISSILGISASAPSILAQSPYVAAKHAVIGLTKQAASEYGQFGIRVNCIVPGFFKGTRLPESFIFDINAGEKGMRERRFAAGTPLGRVADPKELRGLLLYLASENSSFMTGATIVCDGGWTIW